MLKGDLKGTKRKKRKDCKKIKRNKIRNKKHIYKIEPALETK
jgi:hypothetical protein